MLSALARPAVAARRGVRASQGAVGLRSRRRRRAIEPCFYELRCAADRRRRCFIGCRHARARAGQGRGDAIALSSDGAEQGASVMSVISISLLIGAQTRFSASI